MTSSDNARALRKRMTDAELRLWDRLRRRTLEGFRFRKQMPIGPYIADFVCLERRLVVEVDGGQHAIDVERDNERTAWLESQNFRVIRFWNNDVLSNIDGVLDTIRRTLLEGSATEGSSPLATRHE